MLANYDYKTKDAVFSPYGSGCESLISFAMKQVFSGGDKCVLGLFDPPARHYVDKNTMTFSAPYKRLEAMIENMDNSFLNTYIWNPIQKRMG